MTDSPAGVDPGLSESGDGWPVFLDLIALFAENLKWLIVLPLLAGAATAGAVLLVERSYTSSAVIGPIDDFRAQLASIAMNNPATYDQVASQVPDYQSGVTPDKRDAALALSMRFFALPGGSPQGKLYALEVSGSSPDLTYKLASAFKAELLKQLRPRTTQREEIELKLAQKEQQLADLPGEIQRVEIELQKVFAVQLDIARAVEGASRFSTSSENFLGMLSAIELLSAQAAQHRTRLDDYKRSRFEIEAEVRHLKQSLAGPGRELIVAEPAVPTSPSWPPRRQYVVRATAGTFVLVVSTLLMAGFINHIRTMSRVRPELTEKVVRIENALRPWQKRSGADRAD